MHLAYADPPYPGQAKRHYADDPRCAEVDHAALVLELETYDGWALSTSSPSLRDVLAVCPPDIRIASWGKTFASFKPGVNPGYCWEPVIFKPAPRRRPRSEPTVRDFIATPITLKRGVHGAKPEAFCLWLFELIGARDGDTLYDKYPGSGAVTEAWERWQSRLWAV